MIMANDNCVIQGGWVLLFRASRLAGVAPVQLETHRNGYSVSLSQSYNIYSKIFIILLNLTVTIGIIIHYFNAEIEINLRGPLFWLSYDIILCSVLVLVGSYKSVRRMKNFVHCMGILQEVESNIHMISDISTKPISIRKASFLLYFVIYCPIVIHSLIGNNILILTHVHPSATLFFIVHQFVYIAKLFLELQINYIALKVFVTVKLLNHELEGMLRNTGPVQTICRKIRTLAHSYSAICDVALKTNEVDGFIMFLIFVNIIYSIISNGYIVYLTAVSPRVPNAWFHRMNVIICIFSTMKILVFIESYHRIFDQTINTRVILSKLIYHLTGVGECISIDLEIMFKQLILNEPHYSPMGIFSLSRSNIITVFSIISTCAVYLVQMNAT